MIDTTRKRFINNLSEFRLSCLGKRAYYRTFEPDWRQFALSSGVMASVLGAVATGLHHTVPPSALRIQNQSVRLESLAMTAADNAQAISVRPVTAGDEDLLLEIYQSSRGDDLRELRWPEDRIREFLGMQYEAQQRFFESEYKRADDDIILFEGKPAGRLIVERREHEIRCIDVALLPQHRNRGIGTLLIQRLQAEAASEKKPLRLQVIRFNRAVNLLERSGFMRVSETGTHFQLEWAPRD
jgi:GNAT superfamily N-acetyltransferase